VDLLGHAPGGFTALNNQEAISEATRGNQEGNQGDDERGGWGQGMIVDGCAEC
jgi:hypothetical protein